MNDFTTKDSGERVQLANGMVRDTENGKDDYTLMLDGPMFGRWMKLLVRGAVKYQPRNWCLALKSTDKAEREKTKERFKRSAFRHFIQWIRGETDEDHAAAVLFNLNGYEAMLETDHVAAAPDDKCTHISHTNPAIGRCPFTDCINGKIVPTGHPRTLKLSRVPCGADPYAGVPQNAINVKYNPERGEITWEEI